MRIQRVRAGLYRVNVDGIGYYVEQCDGFPGEGPVWHLRTVIAVDGDDYCGTYVTKRDALASLA